MIPLIAILVKWERAHSKITQQKTFKHYHAVSPLKHYGSDLTQTDE